MSTLVLLPLRLKCRGPNLLRAVYYSSQPQQEAKNEIGKVVNVAIIGAPNAGKSTLINRIVERKICAASNKVHTTTKMVRAMYYDNNTQIVFLDTPGIVNAKEQKKYKLPESMLEACHKSLRCADVIGVVHDVSNKWTKDFLNTDVINMLQSVKEIPSFLILNKVDVLKSKGQLLSIIRNITNGVIAGNPIPNVDKRKKLDKGYSYFSDVFLVSAFNGDGVGDIKEYLINNSKTQSLHYSPSEWSDQTPEKLIEEAVRAKFLDFLSNEIPYNLAVQLEYYDEIEEQDKILCSVSVECPSERLSRLISGAGGGRLHQIKSQVNLRTVGKKILSDQLLASPGTILCFYYGMGMLEKKSFQESTEEIKAKIKYTYMGDCLFWPPVQFVNFYFLPTHYRVFYINIATMIFNVFLSYMKHYDQSAKIK